MSDKPTRQEQEEAIRRRAYEHWENEGRPDSQHLEHWLRAEEEMKQSEPGAEDAELAGNSEVATDAAQGSDAAKSRKAEQGGKGHRPDEETLLGQKASQRS